MNAAILKILRAAALAVLLVVALAPRPSIAADDDPGSGFLNPFPENDVYQVSVIGDWYSDGLLDGFVEVFGTDTRLNIDRKVDRFLGVMRNKYPEDLAELDRRVDTEPMNVAIVMFGQEDRVSLKNAAGRKVSVASPEWLAEYSKRIDRVMKALRRKNAAVYWVGMPNLARGDANEQAQKMNDVIRERAYLNGCKYIDVYAGFADEGGGYSAYGPDVEGKIRVLRGNDGVSFTRAGNLKLAHFVEKELRRDLNKARANRTVPLLGAEEEQAKINPENAFKTPSPTSPAAADAKASGTDAATAKAQSTDGAQTAAGAATGTSADQKAENSKITLKLAGENGSEVAQTLEIVRPAIPASVIALMARRQGAGQAGDLLIDQIPGGLTLMSSIAPSGSSKLRGRMSPTQAPYFRLLVKGERLTPKPGRADDTSWPRGDAASDSRRPGAQPRG